MVRPGTVFVVAKFDTHPVEGYVHQETDGRPRSGVRYRNPGGDRRVLRGLAVLFVGGCLLGALSGWVGMGSTTERGSAQRVAPTPSPSYSLTEVAFGGHRVKCAARVHLSPLPHFN